MDDKKAEKIATEYPGHINFSGQLNGHYSGAKAVSFPDAEDMNAFFEANQHVIVTYVMPQSNGSILCIYTVQLESKHLRYLSEWNEKVNDYIAMREEQDAQTEVQAALSEVESAKETERLAALGRQCELNHPKKNKKEKK